MRLLIKVDVWREQHPSVGDYSFLSHHHQSYSRIDMVFVSNTIVSHIVEVEIGIHHLSDHAPVILKWRAEEGKIGSGVGI